eukprot:TRINITY_DN17710_c0_g2_i2.p1 TRINITY_DN17710_c0_g2~~TRINITY_DN17710_c0_g2_i2.p1  ORF type:complete len:232 (+),score=27.46 TRINITY_DN17710_c0_g2_i2:237-932(+)
MSLLAGHCGPTALAAHVAVSQVLVLLYMVPNGLCSATASLVGNFIGEGNCARAKKAFALSCAGTLVLFVPVSLLVFAARWPLARLFSSDADVNQKFADIAVPLVPFLLLDALQTTVEGCISGLKLQKQASKAKLATMVGIRLLGAYVITFPLQRGVVGIWWGGMFGMAVTLFLYLRIIFRADFDEISAAVRQRLCADVCSADGNGAVDLPVHSQAADVSDKDGARPERDRA